MKWKKAASIGLAAVMAASLLACGAKEGEGSGESTKLKYTDIKLGETGTDIKTEIKVLNNRTDLLKDDYAGKPWSSYIEEFNKEYPNITVNIEGVTDYAEDSLLRLQGGDWGDIMMIPEVDKSDLPTYFLSYGSLEDVSKEANYIKKWSFDNEVYGIPSTAVGRGIVYNKKVFEQAGIAELPATPEEFMADLKAIKEKTQAIPLYTNYFAGWTMGAWDDYVGSTATGDETYMNQTLLHTKAPFKDPGDGTHAYNVYKILYDAVQNGYTEDDYTTTDWESSKGMINNGKIGCMVLGSWAYSQMQQAGENADDIGYMPFPITVDGKRYSQADSDYNFAINIDTSAEKQEASMIFVKWMAEKSGFSYNEGGLPINAGNTAFPEVYQSFMDNNIVFLEDELAVKGEEDLKNTLNADSELMIAAGGNTKIQALIEHAANKDMSFDAIMEEWNQKWAGAQEANGVEAE